jgi:hypothetical protein
MVGDRGVAPVSTPTGDSYPGGDKRMMGCSGLGTTPTAQTERQESPMKRSRAFLTLTALVTASLIAIAPAANARADVYSESGTDSSPYDARGDIVTIGANYSAAGNILLAAKTSTPVDPATDFNWVQNATGIVWNIDTNGDGQEDYWAVVVNVNGVRASVWRTGGSSPICQATPGFDASTVGVYVYFPGSCIGNPASFSIEVGSLYDRGSSTTFDAAPNGTGFCCNVTPGDPPPPPPPPPPAPEPQPQPDPDPQPDPGFIPAVNHDGYWMLTQSGSVFGFGTARDGSVPAGSNVHIEPTPSGDGYWVLNSAGNVASQGDAISHFFGHAPLNPGERAVSLSATPSGNGYWVFTDKGRVINLGDAQHFGDMNGVQLNGPVLGSVATPTGKGYWMVGSDGGIFSFGDAAFHGSTGNLKLNKPVMAMAPAADGSGYWLVASDGGIFAFDVPFYGSMGSTSLNKPISGMVPGPGGYMMVGQDGGIFSFGSVAFHGSLGGNPPASPVVSVALQP